MKNKKYLFNLLLIKYNKYKAKLLRFRLTGRNEHRQSVLEKHIERLSAKLNDLLGSLKKAGAVATVSTAMVLAAPNSADAQAIFAGQTSSAITSPFGLSNLSYANNADFVDLDGDGDLDLMSGNNDGNFYYYQNTAGVGNMPMFGSPEMNPFGLSDIGSYSYCEIIDIDGDGDLDLMSGSDDGNFYYFRNIGSTGSTPSFASPETNPFGLTDIGYRSTPHIADSDGDGDLDFMSGDYGGNFRFLNTAGAGNTPVFGVPSTNPIGLSDIGYNSNHELKDIDGDGDLDVLSGASDGNFYFFERTAGSNFFSAAVTNPFGLSDIGYWSTVELVDIDSDGDLDLVSGSYYGVFNYFENSAGAGNTPNFTSPQVLQINPFGLSTLSTAVNTGNWSSSEIIDIDGDGDLDLISGSNFGDFFYYENSAAIGDQPSFVSPPASNPFGLTDIGNRSNVKMIDIDGDGDLDLMSGQTNGNFYYFENTAGVGNSPSFTAAETNPFGLSDIGSDSYPELVDLNGDGDLDLISGEANGNFYYFENTAGVGNTPSFEPPVTNPFGLTDIGNTSNTDIVDFDGDGDLDLMSGMYSGNFFYFENVGGAGNTPIFSGAVINPFGLTQVEYNINNSNLVDLDSDGDLDLMSGNSRGDFFYFENITCEVNPLMVTLDEENDILCNGETNGSITLSASAGNTPYDYSINGGTTTQPNNVFNNLGANTYNILVSDANGCEATLPNSVVIQEPDTIAFSSFGFTPASAPNASDGEITLVAGGGTGQLTITWNPGNQIGATASGLSTGNYTVTVTDENNCEKSTTVFLDFEPETPNAINSIALEDLAIYPNPTTGLVTVSFETTEQLDVEFNIVNTIGKTVLLEIATAVNGSFATTFNLSDLETGVYFLQMNNGKEIVTKKITISK